MKHTECKDCKLRNGDCGYHSKSFGKTNFDIPNITALDKYGNCEFFQQKEKPQGDLISRSALIKTLEEMADNEWNQQVGSSKGLEDAIDVIEYAPTVLFPLTVKIKDNVNDEDIKTLKRLMADYKPQILNLETERPRGEWNGIKTSCDIGHKFYFCSVCSREIDLFDSETLEDYPFCHCGADMRKGDNALTVERPQGDLIKAFELLKAHCKNRECNKDCVFYRELRTGNNIEQFCGLCEIVTSDDSENEKKKQ